MNKLTEFLIKPFLNEDILEEGARDPGIFKAIFLAGGPGSGKSYVASKLFGIPEKINVSKTGLKMVNQDSELEMLLNKYFGTVDLDHMPDELFQDLTGTDREGNPVDFDTSGLRKFAKSLSKERLRLYTEGRLGVIIDGTGHKFSSVKEKRQKLMNLGYDTYMVFVNTSLEVALKRNEERPRALPPKIVQDSWRDVQSNLAFFQGLFGGGNFLIVDNNKFLSEKEATKKFKMLVNMGIDKFLKKPIKSKIAKSWLRKQKKFQKVFKDPGQSRFFENVNLPIKVGDTVRMGRFKNKKVVVKSIDWNEKGDLLINGRPALKFRVTKQQDESKRKPRKKGQHRQSSSHSDLYTDENPKGTIKGLKFATVKDAQASVSKIRNSGKSHAHKIQAAVAMEQRAREMGKTSQAAVYRAFINKMKKKTKSESLANADGTIPSPSRKMVKKMKKKGNTSVPYGSGYKSVDECIAVAKKFGDDVVIGKNRDRNYNPNLKVVRELDGYGTEVCYVVDQDTDWSEGMNSHGIGLVNSALFVKRDEKDFDKAKKKKAMSKDGTRIREALQHKTLKDVVKSLLTYQEGIKGHTIVSDGKKVVTIENTSRVDASVKIHDINKEVVVRTNHGMEHPEQGYQRGPDKLSSQIRMKNAMDILNKTDDYKKVFPAFYNHTQNKGAKYDLVRAQNKLWTSSQVMMNLNKKELTLYLIPGAVKFLGIENTLPNDYKAQIKLSVRQYEHSPADKYDTFVTTDKADKKSAIKDSDVVTEEQKIKKTIGVFGGRFQPFHEGHLATYKWLSKQVDEAYITTSDIKMPPRHPMNFKEKVRHMTKMGIPKNRIVKERTPYVAENLLKKFNPKTTAVVYAFGQKDAGRLKAGTKKSGGKTYYQDYKKSKGDIKGYEEHGYFVTAPQFGSVSGTQMRKLLGDPKIDDSDREKAFKKSFGYFDKGVYNMMTNKFRKLFESTKFSTELIKEFLADINIEDIIKENSTNTKVGSDDGPGTFYQSFADYNRVAADDLPLFMQDTGWKVLNLILSDNAADPDFDFSMIENPISAVTFGRAGSIPGDKSAALKYKERLSSIVEPLGWELVKWLGLDGKGVQISQKPGDEYGKGKASWSAKGTKGEKARLDKKKKFDFSPDLKERINLKKEVQMLIEGGAYGHLNHPFDNKNLTFSDFKTLIINTLQGKLDSEGAVTEKTDGQNIMISWKNGKLIAARNKGHIKNHGASALDISGVQNMFSGRGDIEKAFVSAMTDLQKALKGLSKKQKDKIFAEGKKFMSLEVIYPATANVIPYDKSLLQFHGTIEYDEAGSPIGEDRDSARMLAGMIKQINQNIQKTYSITKPFVTKLPQVKNFAQRQSYFLGKLARLQNQYKLTDKDTLADYHQAYWMEYIYNGAKQTDYKNISNKVLMNLTKRWAFFDKSYKVPMIKKDLKDYPKFLDWVLSTDKMDHARLQKKHIRDWEVLFFELGAEILKNMSDFIAANPSQAAQQIRKDLQKAIGQVRKSKDPKVLNTLKTQLDRLNAIGGLKSVVPSEGITFVFKGKLYKYTGAFAPANQILGMLKFV